MEDQKSAIRPHYVRLPEIDRFQYYLDVHRTYDGIMMEFQPSSQQKPRHDQSLRIRTGIPEVPDTTTNAMRRQPTLRIMYSAPCPLATQPLLRCAFIELADISLNMYIYIWYVYSHKKCMFLVMCTLHELLLYNYLNTHSLKKMHPATCIFVVCLDLDASGLKS